MPNKVVHFEIHADDPQRALKFYGEVFGWKFQQFGPEPYWLTDAGPESERGINGAIQKRIGNTTCAHVVGVASVDEFINKVKAGKGQVTTTKMPIPGIGWYANCVDTEGNAFGIFQDDKAAK